MTSQTTSYCRRVLQLGVLFIGSILSAAGLSAQTTTGVIQGRVLNASTGAYLNNARVSIEGTSVEAFTDSTGNYWLKSVPTGQVVVTTHFLGMNTESATVSVTAGETAVQDFELTLTSAVNEDGVVQMESVSVEAKTMTGQAVALTEQRNAANIKNVIALDEFVDMADGNIGEFLKFVPGMDIEYNPFFPSGASIRGMPASGTLVQFDGVAMAASAGSTTRSFDLNTAANANLDRIEVSKVPTPDMPANAVGGSINVISKSGFTQKKPVFKYNVYMTYNAQKDQFDPSFGKIPGPDDKSTKRATQLAYDFSYLLPIKNKVAFSFALTHTPRSQRADFLAPTWDLNQLLVGSQYLGKYTSNMVSDTAKIGVDWKIGKHSTLQVNYSDTDRVSGVRYDRVRWITSASGRTGDADTTSGRGAAQQANTANHQYRTLSVFSMTYRYAGPEWKADASISHSKGGFRFTDVADGVFATVLAASPNNNYVVVGHQAINDGRAPDITATAVSGGAPVDIYDSSIYSITSATSNERVYKNQTDSAGFNVSREFDFTIPTTIKMGGYVEENTWDQRGGVKTYTFSPPGGAAARLVSNYDLTVPSYIDSAYLTTASGKKVHPEYISLAKLYDLYRQNPSWFVLNEAAANLNTVNASLRVKETVSAAYFRMDNKFMQNRLRITSGVRYERTDDEGRGPQNINGVPVERGYHSKTNYDGFYPSINTSYALGENFVVRAAYARTIGRPDLDDIVPSVTIVDPTSSDNGRVRITDGSLQPWSSDNYDLTVETYNLKGVTASISAFQKDVTDFFVTSLTPATSELLASVGLPDSYLGYDVTRTGNSADAARIRGIELSYRQSFPFVSNWARGFQFFANYTRSKITGPGASNFTRVPDEVLSAGLSYVNKKFVVKLNARYEDFIKIGTAGTTAYTYLSPTTRWDFSTQYTVYKNVSVFFSVRNLTAEPQRRSVLNFDNNLPSYTYPRDWRYLAAAYTLGVKGSF